MTDRLHAEHVDAHLHALIETAHDGIVTADESGHITLFNRAAERLFGWAADDIIGRPLTTLMPAEYRDFDRQGLERLRMADTSEIISQTMELHGRRRDGSEFPMEMSLSSWHAGDDVFLIYCLETLRLMTLPLRLRLVEALRTRP